MKVYGLIGYPLTHSFSKDYFSRKFEDENIRNVYYENFEIKSIDDLPAILESYPDLYGLNVTIPYKESVLDFIQELDVSAEKIGAVNVVKIMGRERKFMGFNSDYYGFRISLERWLGGKISSVSALLLGTGGAAKAVKVVLKDTGIPYKTVSRDAKKGDLVYYDLINDPRIIHNHHLIINTTPIGMHPHVHEAPQLPYDQLSADHYLYDLIYNPEETLFLRKGKEHDAHVKNGHEMLVLQAEKSWEIWNR